MVLHAERAAKSQCLRLDVVFDPVVVALGTVELTAAAPCRSAAEQSEVHESSSWFGQCYQLESPLRERRGRHCARLQGCKGSCAECCLIIPVKTGIQSRSRRLDP